MVNGSEMMAKVNVNGVCLKAIYYDLYAYIIHK